MSVHETVYFSITIASPVHIGCGDVYEPMSFVVDEEDLELVTFDTGKFMGLLTDTELEKLSSICRKGTVGSLQELYKFMRQHRHVATGSRVSISEDFARHYDEVLKKDTRKFARELNRFEINRTYFNPVENVPVIPGSAIKGAIRTAVLNYREQQHNRPKNFSRVSAKKLRYETKKEAGRLEKKLLGGAFDSDPFRLIKVSDFKPVGNVSRKICYAVGLKKKTSEKSASAIPQMQEVIEPGSTFWGSITVTKAPSSIRKPVTMQEIQEALAKLYGSEKQREDRELANIQITPPMVDNDCIPMRIGRHSGAECVTVKGHRKIKIMQGPGNRPKFKDHATTVWLASPARRPRNVQGLLPMGWTVLKKLSTDEVRELQQEQDKKRATRMAELKRQREEALRAEQERLARQQAEEEAQRRKEKQKAKEKERQKALAQQWESMSPVEQYIAIVRGDEIARAMEPSKEPVRDIWPKLNELEGEEQKALAQAFKEIWEKESSTWRKKKCTSGQWKKVERLLSILEIDHPDLQKISEQDKELVERISNLKDWGAYKSSGINLKDLSRPAAEALLAKLRQWGCDNKKAKKVKIKAFEEVKAFIRTLPA